MPANDNANYEQWAKWLADQARILGEARMLRDEDPFTEDAKTIILQRYRAVVDRLGKNDAWAAKSMDVGASTLSQILSNTYLGDVEKVVRKIDKWVEVQVMRETAPKPAGFVKTKVVGQIFGLANRVKANNVIGIVHGRAGTGKTITLQAVRAETPGAILITITPSGQSKLAVLESLAREARIGGFKLSSDRIYQQLVTTLRGTNRLIIVDEISLLEGRKRDEALHTLRSLHDETRCPMLWAGTSAIADYIQSGKSRYHQLDQLDSRIGFWLSLREADEGVDGGPGLFTVDDIRKWVAAQQVRAITDDAIRFLQMLANTPGIGGLRTCDMLMRVAVTKFEGRQITGQMLRDLRAGMIGLRAAEAQDQQMHMRIARTA